MKSLIYILSIYTLAVVACNSKPVQTNNSPVKSDSSSKFLSRFKQISFDTLKVYSPGQVDDKNDFVGVPLDSADAILFPKQIADAHLRDFPGLFACYKFSISKDKIGLIVRAPAMYVSSSIKLFIYDLNTNKLTESLELAENWGDAGDSMIKTSWLYTDKNKINAFMWISEGHDNSVENESDSTITLSDKYSLLEIHPKIDTLSEDSLSLEKRFRSLLPNRNIHSNE